MVDEARDVGVERFGAARISDLVLVFRVPERCHRWRIDIQFLKIEGEDEVLHLRGAGVVRLDGDLEPGGGIGQFGGSTQSQDGQHLIATVGEVV